MKLSDLTAKLTSLKSNTTRMLAAATLAGAVLAAAAPAAQAQRVAFGVRIGGPVYVGPPAPVYVAPRFYADGRTFYNRWDYDAYLRHRDFDRDRFYAHERFDHDHFDHDRGHDWR